jgi:glutaryl-CoA dehydrogenase
MATQQAKSVGKTDYAPPPIEGDFYRIAAVLNDSERTLLKRVREFTEGVIAPVIEDYWSRDAFPFEIIPKMAEVGIGGVGYQGYGAAGGNWLLNGLVSMELARVDASVATFWGVHTGLSAGSIYLCGDEQQKQRWLPPMMRFDKIGSFGLTEPLVGSATSGGMMTTCRREGDVWILNGQKKWIGNATFADINVIWAREEESNQVKGFVVGRENPGFSVEKIKTKMALRVVQNGLITLKDCRVPETDRLQNANTYRQGSEDDPHRGGMVCRWLPDGRLRACAALCDGADAIREADRRIPACPGSAGAHAWQRHIDPGDDAASCATSGRRCDA